MIYLFCLFVVLIPLFIENFRVARARNKVPVRVHIHGTRGKTSAVKLTATLLKNSGLKVLAKTTGDCPEIICPDGEVKLIKRKGPARIIEQIKILELAAQLEVDALVVEGMALTRETIWFSEYILRATHFAIVNDRQDHGETMGENPGDCIEVIACALPGKGKLFLSDECHSDFLKKIKKQSIEYFIVKSDPLLQSQEIAKALASDILGRTVVASPLKCPIPEIKNICQKVEVLDLFSANDVESVRLVLDRLEIRQIKDKYKVALLVTREDRPMRTKQFVNFLFQTQYVDLVVLLGNHAYFAKEYAFVLSKRKKCHSINFLCMHNLTPQIVLQRLSQMNNKPILIVGLGNTHGQGEIWRNFWEKGCRKC